MHGFIYSRKAFHGGLRTKSADTNSADLKQNIHQYLLSPTALAAAEPGDYRRIEAHLLL